MARPRRQKPVEPLEHAADGRGLALKLLLGVYRHERNLDIQIAELTDAVEDQTLDQRELALARELASGVLRHERSLHALLRPKLKRPFKSKDKDLELLALLGLYQLRATRVPAHAAVNQTVELCNRLNKPWARSLLNALLRGALRDEQKLIEAAERQTEQRPEQIDSPAIEHSHPDWMYDAFTRDWGSAQAQTLMRANNQRAPMWLRVNTVKIQRDEYAAALTSFNIEFQIPELERLQSALLLPEPVAVARLPGFAEGQVSVQDGGAQLAGTLLDLEPNLRIADACAAPGGKSFHILQTEPQLDELVSIEIDPKRAAVFDSGATRLGLAHRATIADFARLDQWWDKRAFDRILLDAPCSATGVIRRHPDIKALRQAEDLADLIEKQSQLLEAAWRVLNPKGLLLYVTCSVLRDENDHQIQAFLERHADAEVVPIDASWGRIIDPGRQILPGEHDMDGFYFARLRKLPRPKRAVQ